jgi:hypothetical protein
VRTPSAAHAKFCKNDDEVLPSFIVVGKSGNMKEAGMKVDAEGFANPRNTILYRLGVQLWKRKAIVHIAKLEEDKEFWRYKIVLRLAIMMSCALIRMTMTSSKLARFHRLLNWSWKTPETEKRSASAFD